jgi:hypothetical protein
MKELLIGDCHFGTHSNNITWLNWQKTYFENAVIPLIEEQHFDRIIFLGDVFDVRYSTNTQVGFEVKKLFRKILSYNVQTIIVAGNHDYYSPLKELQHYNSYDLVFGEEFLSAYKNLTIVTDSELFIDGDLFLSWYFTEDEDEWSAIATKYNNKTKRIFCHSDLNQWSKERLEEIGNPTVYAGHIHYPWIDENLKLYNIGACMAFNFNDVNSSRHLWILEDGELVEKVENTITPKFKRFYNEHIFKLTDEDMRNSIVQLCISQQNVNKARYIEQIKFLKSEHIETPIKVNIIDNIDELESLTAVQFNTNIDSYIEDNIPDYLREKFETVKEKIKNENL